MSGGSDLKGDPDESGLKDRDSAPSASGNLKRPERGACERVERR